MEVGSDRSEVMLWDLFLKFNEELHPFPFVGSVEEFTVSLQNASGTIIRGRSVPFYIRLFDLEWNEEYPVEVLGSASKREISPLTGRSPPLKVRFLDCTPRDRELTLQVLPFSPDDSSLGLAGDQVDPIEAIFSEETDLSQALEIAPAEASLQQVVRHRFEIVNKFHQQDVPAVYFKDEGGQKNTINLLVQLVDELGRKVEDRPGVKVKPLLCYESGEKVADQSILKICEGSSLFLGEQGQAVIRCQIRDISQHHGHQKFKVLVAADSLEDKVGDMSSVSSPGILVRTKISAKNRQKRLAEQDDEGIKSLIKTKENEALLNISSKRKRKNSEDVRCISPDNTPCPPALLNATLSMIEFIDSSIAKLQELAEQDEAHSKISDIVKSHKVYRRKLVENNLCNLPIMVASSDSFSTPSAVAEEFDAKAKNVASSLGPNSSKRGNSLFLE